MTQPLPANSKTSYRRHRVVYYRYSASRARRSIRGINEQIAKAEKAVEGKKEPEKRESESAESAQAQKQPEREWYWDNEPDLLKKIKVQNKIFQRIVKRIERKNKKNR